MIIVLNILCIRNSVRIEYLRPKEGVEGSNPSGCTYFYYIADFIINQKITAMASVASK